jgi:hypothetical protein
MSGCAARNSGCPGPGKSRNSDRADAPLANAAMMLRRRTEMADRGLLIIRRAVPSSLPDAATV